MLKYPPTSEDLMRKPDAKGRACWNLHAKNYDRSMMLIGRPIPRMVELAAEAVRGAPRVLEVAADTGLVAPRLARAAREIIATDYAAAMVTALEARVREAGIANVRCEQALPKRLLRVVRESEKIADRPEPGLNSELMPPAPACAKTICEDSCGCHRRGCSFSWRSV